jgi:hypothetical protein
MKRIVFAVVNGAMGAMVGLLVALVTGRNIAIVVCAVLGAAISLLVRPGQAYRK